MKHLEEETLILHFYGESDEITREHLRGCLQCREHFQQLTSTLRALPEPMIPHRDEHYGSRVWQSLESKLPATQVSWKDRLALAFSDLPSPRLLTLVASAASLLVLAFLAGRFFPHEGRLVEGPAVPTQRSAGLGNKLLVVEVNEHLERTRLLLVELVNAPDGDVDIALQQEQAAQLLASNRLFRQTSAQVGEASVSSVLSELERLLLDIANSPSNPTEEDLTYIRERVQSQNILFKVRVLKSSLNEKQRSIFPGISGNVSREL